MVPLLGLLILLRVPLIWWRILLVSTLLGWYLIGIFLMVLLLMRSLCICLILQIFGLMVVWSWTRSLVFLLLVLAFLLTILRHVGVIVGGGHVDRVQSVGVDHSCRACVSVPGPLQTVQRAELWEVILALQSDKAVHVGVDNLGVVRHGWSIAWWFAPFYSS